MGNENEPQSNRIFLSAEWRDLVMLNYEIDAVTLNKLGLGSETAGKGAPVPAASTTKPTTSPSSRESSCVI